MLLESHSLGVLEPKHSRTEPWVLFKVLFGFLRSHFYLFFSFFFRNYILISCLIVLSFLMAALQHAPPAVTARALLSGNGLGLSRQVRRSPEHPPGKGTAQALPGTACSFV